MKTVVFGKIVENVYEVDTKLKEITDNTGKIKKVYADKPIIKKITNVKEWKEICSFEGLPAYNDVWNTHFNISEDETVCEKKRVFRADLNELHLYTNKVLEEGDFHRDAYIDIYNGHIKEFNKMMIESNDSMKAYCDLHKLSYEDTNCITLFSVVYPEKNYEIVDGVMKVKADYITCTSPIVGSLTSKIMCACDDAISINA